MIIYNVTVKTQGSIAADWLTWMKEEHIPDILSTGCFLKATIHHLYEADDEEGITYVVQYTAEDREAYQNYLDRFAEEMRNKAIQKWGNRFIAFRTVMEVVH